MEIREILIENAQISTVFTNSRPTSQTTKLDTGCQRSSDPFYIPFVREVVTHLFTVCPRSSGQFYIVSNYIKWVNTSWTYSSRVTL